MSPFIAGTKWSGGMNNVSGPLIQIRPKPEVPQGPKRARERLAQRFNWCSSTILLCLRRILVFLFESLIMRRVLLEWRGMWDMVVDAIGLEMRIK